MLWRGGVHHLRRDQRLGPGLWRWGQGHGVGQVSKKLSPRYENSRVGRRASFLSPAQELAPQASCRGQGHGYLQGGISGTRFSDRSQGEGGETHCIFFFPRKNPFCKPRGLLNYPNTLQVPAATKPRLPWPGLS